MKAFFFGLLLGLIVGFPLGINVGKGAPLFSNPFAERPIAEQIKDTAENASEKLKETTDEVIQGTEEAIDEAE